MILDVDTAIELGIVWGISETQAALAAGASYRFGFITGSESVVVDNILAQTTQSTGSGVVATFTIHENTPFTGGTPMTTFRNRNRTQKNRTTHIPILTPTTGVTATPNAANLVAGGQLAASAIGQYLIDNKTPVLILEPNSSHVVTMTNAGAQTATLFIGMTLRQQQGL